MKAIDILVITLLVVGGLNWGLVGLFGFDLVAAIFGEMTFLSRVVYSLVGLAAVYQAVTIKSLQRRWSLFPATR
ncbi:MAG: DUF378 domain-containing protein [Calditrichota bacterium]